MRFVYDPHKNEENLAKHHVSFEEAAGIWEDPNLVILHAKRRGEKRLMAIGQTFAVLYSVIHTRRGDAIRIISARRATMKERRVYERNNRY